MWAAIRRRTPQIAIASAVIALVVAIVAGVVVVRRDTAAARPADPAEPAFEDRLVAADDVVQLNGDAVEVAMDRGRTVGVRVREPLRRGSGFAPKTCSPRSPGSRSQRTSRSATRS